MSNKEADRFRLNIFYHRAGIVFFLASLFVVLFTYRLGSLRVDKGQTPGLRDIGTYFDGGLSIIAGDDPYQNTYFRIGPTGGLILGVFAKLFPEYLAATIIMALSVLGFVYFLATFAGFRKSDTIPWALMGVLVFISAHRENLVNIQITGILALCVSAGFRLLESKSPTRSLIGVSLIAIAVETKPHVLALFVLAMLIYQKTLSVIWMAAIFLSITHALISIHTKTFITLSWMNLILSLGRKANSGQLPERIAFESPFEALGISKSASAIVMLLLFTFAAILLLLSSTKWHTVHLGLVIPSLGIFFHYYDLALAFGLMLTILYASRRYYLLFALLGMYLIPQNFGSISNIFLVFILMLVLCFFTDQVNPLNVLRYIGIGLTSWVVYLLLVQSLNSQIEIHELTMSLSIVISIIVGLAITRKSIHSGVEQF